MRLYSFVLYSYLHDREPTVVIDFFCRSSRLERHLSLINISTKNNYNACMRAPLSSLSGKISENPVELYSCIS